MDLDNLTPEEARELLKEKIMGYANDENLSEEEKTEILKGIYEEMIGVLGEDNRIEGL